MLESGILFVGGLFSLCVLSDLGGIPFGWASLTPLHEYGIVAGECVLCDSKCG